MIINILRTNLNFMCITRTTQSSVRYVTCQSVGYLLIFWLMELISLTFLRKED